ncbi:hypothetical protein SLE2022_010660 [Rubroshorea leprosula]
MGMMEWSWVLLMGLVMGLFWYKKKMDRMENKSGVPKGNLGWPLIGETLDFIASGYSSRPVSFMDKRKFLYGEVFKTHILGTPIIVSTDPEVNKMNGSLHRRVHALIGGFLRSPQFKARITRDIENSVKFTLASWQGMINPVLVQEETKKITFQILVKVLLSVGPGEDLNFLKREFEEFIKGLICLPIKLPGTRLHKSLKAKERLLKMVRKIVEERKLAMETSEGDGGKGVANDAVDVLLRDNGEANEKQSLTLDLISGNIIEMMIPGEETVPTAMTLAVYFLSHCPTALNQLKEENMKLKMEKMDSGEDCSWTDYMSLPFTQNVISETLRLANIINAVWRKAQRDIEIKGNLIPKGWCVLASFTSVHMDDQIYQNPYHFDPWRWEKLGAAVNNNNFTPFGGGQRLCPGLELSRLEISIFLHYLVTSYQWVAQEDNIVYFPTVKMKRKMPITVTHVCNHQ